MRRGALIAVAALVGSGAAMADTWLEKLAATGGLISAYEIACAAKFGSLGPQVVEKFRQRAQVLGYDSASPDFLDLVNIKAKKSIAGFKSDSGELCLQVKIGIDKTMKEDTQWRAPPASP